MNEEYWYICYKHQELNYYERYEHGVIDTNPVDWLALMEDSLNEQYGDGTYKHSFVIICTIPIDKTVYLKYKERSFRPQY